MMHINIPILVSGICIVGVGFSNRRHHASSNWRVLALLGVLMIVASFVLH